MRIAAGDKMVPNSTVAIGEKGEEEDGDGRQGREHYELVRGEKMTELTGGTELVESERGQGGQPARCVGGSEMGEGKKTRARGGGVGVGLHAEFSLRRAGGLFFLF
jgi:hypothetical protein